MNKLASKITEKPKLEKQGKIVAESTKPSAELSAAKETENSQRRSSRSRHEPGLEKKIDPKTMSNAAKQVMGRKTQDGIFNRWFILCYGLQWLGFFFLYFIPARPCPEEEYLLAFF